MIKKYKRPVLFIYFFLVNNIIPKILINMVKTLVKRVFEIIVTNESKLKYSRLKTIK